MAFFRLELKMIKRSAGKSAVAAAAYRSAEKIKNQWDGITSDYRRKEGVVFKEVLLPKNAPKEYEERSVLWNAVEMSEPSVKCRLSREFLLSLPVELDLEQQIDVVEQFVRKNMTDVGMCADINIHSMPVRDDLNRPLDADGNVTDDPDKFVYNNPHAHIMSTVRPIGENGKWESKTQMEYLCKRDDEQKGFTKDEIKDAEADGWEKQYRYGDHNGKKVWLTTNEAKECGLDNTDRIHRTPRTTPHGRPNQTVAYWDDNKRAKEWRKSWEDILNKKFVELEMGERVDSRSYKDQGIDKMPGAHMGPYVNKMEKRTRRLKSEGKSADHTELWERDRLSREYNEAAEGYRRADRELRRRIKSSAARSVRLRGSSASNVINGDIAIRSIMDAMDAAKYEEAEIYYYLGLLDKLSALMTKTEREIASLTKKLESFTIGHSKDKVQEQIDSLARERDEYKNYVDEEFKKCKYKTEADLRRAKEENAKTMRNLKEQAQRAQNLSTANRTNAEEYKSIEDSIPDKLKRRFDNEKNRMCPQMEEDVKSEYKRLVKDSASDDEFQKYMDKTDWILTGERKRTNKKRRDR